MRPLAFTLIATLPVLAGCPGMICNCDGADDDLEFPSGEFEVVDAHDESVAAGTATFTEDTVVFSYTDADGNEWEVEYAITE